MLDVFFAMTLIVFGALIIAALATYGMNASKLREELGNLRDRLTHQELRLEEIDTELKDLDLDIELLEMEKDSLEAQESCMRDLDTFNAGEEIRRTTAEERSTS